MDDSFELTALRYMREISTAIKNLENQATAVSKRYKRGQKMLQSEIANVEATLDDGGTMQGAEPWNTSSPELRQLIIDPQLKYIPEDNLV